MAKLCAIAGGGAIVAVSLFAGACRSEETTTSIPESAASRSGHRGLQNTSVTPALVKPLIPGVRITTVLSSDDTLPETPAYVFGGSADGAGLLRDRDGGFTYLVNHEDNFAVSRIRLDQGFRPISGEYLINSTWGQWRLCSATLATPKEHGFGPVFITAGESGQESMIHALNPFTTSQNSSRLLSALGRWSTENAVPLPRVAYRSRTVIIMGDDDFGSTDGGQVALYIGKAVGDLDQGSLFALARVDNVTGETAMTIGHRYRVEFRRIANQQLKYNGAAPSRFGSWEYGSMLDATENLGRSSRAPQGAFVLAIQPHTWRDTRYQNPDGGTLRPSENQASQIVVVHGLPR